MTRRSGPTTVALVGGCLAIALAGCGSSGGGTVAGGPPSSASATPSESPTPSETPSATPSSDDLRSFHDASAGVSLTVPVGYVVAATPEQASERFPDALGSGAPAKITDAQTRLRSNTIMVAYHAPIDGLYDNIGVIQSATVLSNPAQIQSLSYQAQFRTSLTKAGAKNIVFTDTKLGGQPAENAVYSLLTSDGSTVYGQQFYVASDSAVFVTTMTAGSAARAADAADQIASTWEFD